MRICRACLDYELLWVMDEAVYGLYCIDWRNFEAKCVIDFWRLFKYGRFEVQSLLKWKENYIIIIPQEINRSWILYNKITGEVEYRKVVADNYQERLIAVDQDRHQLYFFPIYIHDPAFIVDLNTLTLSQRIENWSGITPNDCCETAWTGAYDGQYVFYPKKNTKTLVRMDCETHKVNLLELDISEKVIDIDYAFEELWVLPMSGNEIYQIDGNGIIINTAKLFVSDIGNLIPNFAKIVVQKRFIFLLPCYQKGIYVYDKLKTKTIVIPKESLTLEEKDKETYLRYWEYCVKDNRICFLPYLDRYIEIDLDTLAYKVKELSYPNMLQDMEKVWKCIWNHVGKCDSILIETDDCNMEFFLKSIYYGINGEDFQKNIQRGNKIWDKLTTVFL